MSTETLTLADFQLAAYGDDVVKTFTGKAHTWDSWVASALLNGESQHSSLTALGQTSAGSWQNVEIQQSGTGDPSSLDFEFVYTDSDGYALTVSNFQIVGTYSGVTTNNHAKKSALAMSGH